MAPKERSSASVHVRYPTHCQHWDCHAKHVRFVRDCGLGGLIANEIPFCDNGLVPCWIVKSEISTFENRWVAIFKAIGEIATIDTFITIRFFHMAVINFLSMVFIFRPTQYNRRRFNINFNRRKVDGLECLKIEMVLNFGSWAVLWMRTQVF